MTRDNLQLPTRICLHLRKFVLDTLTVHGLLDSSGIGLCTIQMIRLSMAFMSIERCSRRVLFLGPSAA